MVPSRMSPRFTVLTTMWTTLLLALMLLLTSCLAACGPEDSIVNEDVAVTSYPADVSHYCDRFQEFNQINPSGDINIRNYCKLGNFRITWLCRPEQPGEPHRVAGVRGCGG